MYLLISLAFCWPLFERPNGLGSYDWDQHLFYYGAVLKGLVEYGQLPFWNPWYCGGNVLWQNPQVALVSPVYPLSLVMPLQLAMKINIVLHYWAGFGGMHLLLTRVIGLSYLPIVMFLATLVTAEGAPAIHFAVGHSVFLPAFYLPLQLFFFCRALQQGGLRDALLAGGVLALMVFNGGVHILPMAMAALGALALFAAVLRRQWRPLLLAVVFAIAGLAYAAPKLLPVALFVTGDRFWDTRPPTEHPDRMTVEMLLRAYLDPYQHRGLKFELQRHNWHEYGNYIGAFGATLIAASVAWILIYRRRSEHWLGLSFALTSLLLLTLSAGEFHVLAPASLAQHLPLFSSFRIPSRYTIAFVLFAAATVAWALRAAVPDARLDASARGLVAIVCLIASAQLMAQNRALLNGVFGQAPFDTTFHLQKGPTELVISPASNPYLPGSPMLHALVNSQAFFNCYESLQLKRTADPDHALVFTEDDAQLFATTFTPNRVDFSVVTGNAPARIVLNQNFAPGWRSTAGAVEAQPGGSDRLSVVLAPGRAGKFSFRFVPPGLVAGLTLFVAALAASIAAWRRTGSRPSG